MSDSEKGKLYLIPTFLSPVEYGDVMPEIVRRTVASLRHFVVEDVRSARRYIKKIVPSAVIDQMTFYPMGKHSSPDDFSPFVRVCESGADVGVISEAGVPAVADPGSLAVAAAHRTGIRVIPLVGPSSILLAVMASGFNGQSFAFNGYLPIDRGERKSKLKELESLSRRTDQSQAFIETPYRNNALLDDVLSACSDTTMLCVACDLTGETEYIRSSSVGQWKKDRGENLDKRPAIFIIYKNR